MTPRRYTLQELTDYSFRNRRGKAFLGWTPEDIGMAFADSLSQNTLFYSVNSHGLINGVVHGVKFDDEKVIFVSNILTTSKGVLKEFVRRFKMMFPGYRLEATRRDKRRVYNTKRLVNKLVATTI